MQARRKQTAITIRSDRAAELLARHVRPGRSQAQVIEDALERLQPPPPDPLSPTARADRRDRALELLRQLPPGALPTMAELDALEYDGCGNPR